METLQHTDQDGSAQQIDKRAPVRPVFQDEHRARSRPGILAKTVFAALLALLWTVSGLGEGVVSEPTETALRAAMAGGGTVTFACEGVIRVSSTVTNLADTIIDGTGHQVAIQGNGVRLFYLPTNTHLMLMNVSLGGGAAQWGAGVFNDGGTLTALGVNWSNNWATTIWTAEPPIPAAGGAIYSRAGTVVATNCTFAGNQAFDSLVQDNDGPLWTARGGALCNDAGVLRLDRCLFLENRAIGGDAPSWQPGYYYGLKAWGGAIYSSGSLSLNQCTFRENSATGGKGGSNNMSTGPGAPGAQTLGGAIWTKTEAVIERSTFCNNTCTGGSGGAAGRKSDPTDASGDIGGAGGKAGGGAIYTEGILTLTGSSFISNSVTGGQGGAGGTGGQWTVVPIGQPGGPGGQSGSAEGSALLSVGLASLANCTFAGNLSIGPIGGAGGTGGQTDRVTAPGGRGGPGGNGGNALGAVHDGAGTLRSTNCTIAYNTANAGAGGAGGAGGRSGAQASQPYGPTGPDGTNGVAVAGLRSAGGVLINTLLALNEPGGNIAGTVVDAGHNLSSDQSPALTNSTSLNGADPKIGALGQNGGLTFTVPILGGSPAISAADPAAAPPVDQRGFHRPLGAAADIGACEYAFVDLVSASVTGDGTFRCEVRGEAGETCVIEASSELLNWVSMQTNTLSDMSLPFADAGAKNYSLRWYRAVLLP